MFPFTISFGIVGCIFLNNYSPNFRDFGHSITTLIIHGYLKPNDLRAETLKSPETDFVEFFQTLYTLLGKNNNWLYPNRFSAATLIVNFLVAIIDESNRIAKQTPKDPDFLEYISFTIKVFTFLHITFSNAFVAVSQEKTRKPAKPKSKVLSVLNKINSHLWLYTRRTTKVNSNIYLVLYGSRNCDFNNM